MLRNYVSGLSVFRNFTEFWGACSSMVRQKHCFHKTAALWFVKVIENEKFSASGSSSQALVLPGAAEDRESCWGCLGVRACVFLL